VGRAVDGLYFPWDADDKIARKVCEIEVVFGGGNIHCITQQVPRP
jgi:agmatine/peptidylarginine deiminase